MEINKLMKKFEKRIEYYETKRDNAKSMPELYGTIICELRFMLCEVCEWYADGILGKENNNEIKGSVK